MTVRILQGDCRDVLRGLPNGSVHCVVTSPPYFGLRDYGVDGQIGLEQTPDAYVAELVSVFREVRRVLRDDGVCFINLGDSYFGGGGGGGSKGSKQRTNTGSLIPGHTRPGVRHAVPYDKPGKEPGGSTGRDCLCESLCDACRAAYRLGKSHSGHLPGPTPSVSMRASSPAHNGLVCDLPPTSDYPPPRGHNADAMHDLQPTVGPEALLPLVSLASTPLISSPPLQGARLQADMPLACLLCGCSLPNCAPASAHKAVCTCDITGGGSVDRKTDMDASGLAHPYYTKASLKPKDLIGIPWMVAFALRADGWWLRQDNIWAKRNCMPESIKDRTTRAHEYLFQLTKSGSSTFWTHRDRIGTRKSPAPDYRWVHKVSHEEKEWEPPDPKEWRRINLWSGHDYFYDVVAIEEEGDVPADTRAAKGSNVRSDLKDVNGRPPEYWSYTGKRNKRSVWHIATQPFPEAHFATFPPDLVEPCILAGTSERGCCSACGAPWTRVTEKRDTGRRQKMADGWDTGAGSHGTIHRSGREKGATDVPVMADITTGWRPSCSCGAAVVPCTVLDPFGGAGTVGLVADRLGRDAVLIELNPEYAGIARRRLEKDGGMFARVSNEAQDAKMGHD